MHPDVEIVVQAQNIVFQRFEGTAWESIFLVLSSGPALAGNTKYSADEISRISERARMIIADVSSMFSLLGRLDWMRRQALQDEYAKTQWPAFAGLDIELFHVYLRSIMDYVADILKIVAEKPEEVRVGKERWGSFERLLNWVLKNPGNRARLGEEFAELVEETQSWFPLIRSLRDEITHHGAMTIVFNKPEDGILFQVFDSCLRRLIAQHELIMYNENVAYFDRYAVLYLSHVVIFLQRLASLMEKRLSLQLTGRATWRSYNDRGTVTAWIDSFVKMANSGQVS